MKLPLIVAQSEVEAGYPQPEASLGLAMAPGRALAQTGEVLTESGLRTTAIYADAQAKLRAAEARNEVDEAVATLKSQLADRDIQLKEQGVEPDAYVAELSKGVTEIGSQLATSMKYPEAQRAFMGRVRTFAAERITTAKYDALKMKQGRIEVMDAVLQREDANAAVFGATPDERRAALARGLERPQERLRQGIYTGAKAGEETQRFLQDVERGQIRRDVRDPAMRAQVISLLVDGAYKHLPAQEQFEMAKTFQATSDREYKDTRDAIDKWFGEQQKMKVAELVSMAATKALTPAALEEARVDWRLSREDYNAIRSELNKPVDEPASDEATLNRIDPDVHSQYPRTTERELRALREGGKLNRKDYLARLDRLRETREALANRGESRQMQAHAQAEQLGRTELGIPTLFDRLEPNKEKAWGAYLRELTDRSNAYKGQEDPLAVAAEILPRYKALLNQETQLTIKQLRDLIGDAYPDEKSLDQNYAAGAITRGAYLAKKRLFIDLNKQLDTLKPKPGENPRRVPGASGSGTMGRP